MTKLYSLTLGALIKRIPEYRYFIRWGTLDFSKNLGRTNILFGSTVKSLKYKNFQ
jgi:hypothetical protein